MPIPFKGALAQLVEHLTFNQVVERSNRSRPTIFPGPVSFQDSFAYLKNIDSAGFMQVFETARKQTSIFHKLIATHGQEQTPGSKSVIY